LVIEGFIDILYIVFVDIGLNKLFGLPDIPPFIGYIFDGNETLLKLLSFIPDGGYNEFGKVLL
jgi:hypothetical protein